MNSFEISFVKSENIAPKVRHFYFEYDLPEGLNYTAGQFITLMLEKEGKLVRRSYSLAAPSANDKPTDKHYVEFAASYVENGFASEFLFNLKEGQKITATGPFGRLVLGDLKPKRFILMATGTGVTPYRAMLPSLEKFLASQPDTKALILFGQRNLEDILYLDQFQAFAAQNPRFEFMTYLSREEGELPTFANKGYIQNALPTLDLNPENDIVFLCGNPNMIDDAFEKLKNLGFTGQNAVREKYISSK